MKEILVTRSSMPAFEEYADEIRELWDSHWLTNMGVKHKQFQSDLCAYLGVDDIELFTNGHMALELSIQSLKMEGEVITTPFTFASTTHAIVRSGLTPVFCDIDPVTYTMDPEKIEALITEKTCAIVPVHVYGNVCNDEAIEAIAKKYNLKVIYDAAHAFGESFNGKGVSSMGDVSIYSFHATKVFNTIEGGAVCFKDKNLKDSLTRFRNFGIGAGGSVTEVGANAKMNEFCAAMGICNLRHLDDEIAKRKAVSDRYRERLGDLHGIQLNVIQEGLRSNYAYFPIVVHPEQCGTDRDEIFEELLKVNITARKYFYPLISDFDCYKDNYDSEATPVAKMIAERVLCLPIYADLASEDVDLICDIIRKTMNRD